MPRSGPVAAVLAVALLAATTLAPASRAAAAAEVDPARRVKAAFLYNFAKFAAWPADAAADRPGPFGLCLLTGPGVEDFAAALAEIGGKDVNGQPVAVRALASPAEAAAGGGCRLLFLPAGSGLAALRAAAARPGLLTVGDSPGFARAGAAINLYLADGKVRFEVNVAAARRAGVTLSSKLLNLATIVEDAPP